MTYYFCEISLNTFACHFYFKLASRVLQNTAKLRYHRDNIGASSEKTEGNRDQSGPEHAWLIRDLLHD